MYGGLFGELPLTKKAQSPDKETAVDAASQDSQQEKDTHQNDASTSTLSEKRPASIISSLGTAGTSMAFVPLALRNRKRNNVVGAGANATKIIPPPPSSSVSSSRAVTEPSKTAQPSTLDQTTTVSHIHSYQAHQEAPALEKESEAMRQLHASVVDAYDPHVPNDLLAYWDRKAMEKERLALEREAKETLQRQEQLRWQLEQERELLLQSGTIEEIVQHRQQTSMGAPRGRGRGVSNLPAWLVQKQRDSLGSSGCSSETEKMSQCTVILSNLTAPGDVDDDLAVEVKEECEKQCGPVINVVTKDAKPPLQPLVQVHVQFVSTADADKAVQIFHGRMFGARRIIAELMRDAQG